MDQIWDTVRQMTGTGKEDDQDDTNSLRTPLTHSNDGSSTKVIPEYSPKSDRPDNQSIDADESSDHHHTHSLHHHQYSLKKNKTEFFKHADTAPLHHQPIAGWKLHTHSKGDKRSKSTTSFFDEIFGKDSGKNRKHQLAKDYKRRAWSSSSLPDDNETISESSESPISESEEPGSEGEASDSGKEKSTPTYTQQMADKLMERFIDMAVPDNGTEDERDVDRLQSRIEMQKSRPPFNVQTISKNSISLLQRLSLPFVMIDEIIRVLNWKSPFYTVFVLLSITLLILRPYLLVAVPFFILSFSVIYPAFIKKYPADKENENFSLEPKIYDIKYPAPVPELSREFILNLTDLQNHMLIYVIPWNWINHAIVKYCWFKDENFTTFLFIFTTTCGVSWCFFGSRLLSYILPVVKLIIIALIWTISIFMHPKNRSQFLKFIYSEDTRLRFLTFTNTIDSKMVDELDWHDYKEMRQLEVYELQRFDINTRSWKFICFTSEIYTVNSHLRLGNLPIDGCMSLEDIAAPKGWHFISSELSSSIKPKKSPPSSKPSSAISLTLPKIRKSKKMDTLRSQVLLEASDVPLYGGIQVSGWSLDLSPNIWVNTKYVSEVLEVDDGTKWCYDPESMIDDPSLRFRRRRWLRTCTRTMNSEEEDVSISSTV